MDDEELKKLPKSRLIDIILDYYNQITYLEKRLELIKEIYEDE